jgi:hypothetical protein
LEFPNCLAIIIINYTPAIKDEAHPFQGLGDPGEVDDAVEWCAQVHHGDVRGVLLWERSILLPWKKAFGQRALRAW